MWGVKLNIMFRGCRFFENIFQYRIGDTQFTYLNKFSIIQSRFTKVGAFMLHNCQNTQVILKWGVRNYYVWT